MLEINKIYNENCLETLKKIPNESIDLILTSPPYDGLRKYDGYVFDFDLIAPELYRVIKPFSSMVWIVGDQTVNGSESGTSFRQALTFKSLGFNLHDTMIYKKNSSTYCARPESNRYTQIFEYMFIFSKGKPKAQLICDKKNKWAGHKDWSKKMRNPVREYSPRTNIWEYVTSFNGVSHPAPFPELLARDHILTWSKENDLVYDPFMGSGTTAKMALLNGRNYIGSEISKSYCEIAEQRLCDARHSMNDTPKEHA